ncbi:hypothetical protein CLOM_g17840 [Closterium sp. NIES-68]|nr:hypothetical protein CLOM_g17840 [Closterium sp. NIES-68]GJP60631.1 hypothetical protein CLOP_g17858 [Closterium sp. NIES-67]
MDPCAERVAMTATTSTNACESLRDSVESPCDSDANSLERIVGASSGAAAAASNETTPVPDRTANCGGTWATRKLKCGSLRLDVTLEVDDPDVAGVVDSFGSAAAGGDSDVCSCIAANHAANDGHFSFEMPQQTTASMATSAVPSLSPTIAWSSRARQFRKSSSASSAPLSVAGGSGTSNAFRDAAAAASASTTRLATGASPFPRVASAGAAFVKPPRSPMGSANPFPAVTSRTVTPGSVISPNTPSSSAPSHRKASGAHGKPQRNSPSTQLAEFARGVLLSPASRRADTSATSPLTGAPFSPASRAVGSPPSSRSGTSPSVKSAASSPISVVRLSRRVGFVNWRHLRHPHTAPASPHSASPHSASPHSASGAVCGRGNGDHNNDSSNGRPTCVAPSPKSMALPLLPQPPLDPFSFRSHSDYSSQSERPAGLAQPSVSPQAHHPVSSSQASSLESPADTSRSNSAFSFRSLSAELSPSAILTCYNLSPLSQPANLRVFIPLQSTPLSPLLSPTLSPLSASLSATPSSSPLRSALKRSPTSNHSCDGGRGQGLEMDFVCGTDGHGGSMKGFGVQGGLCGADAGCSPAFAAGTLKRRVSFSDNLHVICL